MELVSIVALVRDHQKLNVDTTRCPRGISVERLLKRELYKGFDATIELLNLDLESQEETLVFQPIYILAGEWRQVESIHKRLQGNSWWFWRIAFKRRISGQWSDRRPIVPIK